MDTRTLETILREELDQYTGEGLNASSTLTENAAQQLYTIVDIATIRGQRSASTVLIAQIIADKIVIERDTNNKPLVDALRARGVPAEQIILAYQGEPIQV